MNIIEGGRALVFGLEGKHELNGQTVYVECLLHDAIEPEHRVYGVIASSGYGAFEYHMSAYNLLPLDDRDDHCIEEYQKEVWKNF